MITQELCLTAVKKDGQALQYVPEEFKTPEICLCSSVRRRRTDVCAEKI